MIRASILAEGRAKYNEIIAESEAYVVKKEAEAKHDAAEKVADEIKLRGRAEARLGDRRAFELKMAQLGIVQDLANNAHLKIFGDQKDNMLAQFAAFKMVGGGGQ